MKKGVSFIRFVMVMVLFVIITNTFITAQQGMKFAELAQRLDKYFAKELILDLKRELPMGSDYSIWGWDVGDFSGDDYTDVAFTVKLAAEKERVVQVYLFVNIEGYLTKVGQFEYEYVDIPLEIGVVIRHNACFVTRKRKQFDWLIRGYTFDNGSLIWLDEFTTRRKGRLTHETYKNYKTLENTEKYLHTNSGEVEFFADYLAIPSYSRDRQIYKGHAHEPFSYDVDYVHKGAYYWKGKDDASFRVHSKYDSKYLYMTVETIDDKVVTQRCDTCLGDFVEVWMDVIPPYLEGKDRFTITKGNTLKFRTNAEIGIYCFSVYPGDFYEKKPYIKISTTDDLEPYQKQAARSVQVVSDTTHKGFRLKFKIPFALLGFEEAPIYEDDSTELGCTVVYRDIDNEYRPEEETQIATSKFAPLNPSTYGALVLVPDKEWYGDTQNIYRGEILKHLMEYGF